MLPLILLLSTTIFIYSCKKDKDNHSVLSADEIKKWYISNANTFNTESKIFEHKNPDFTKSFGAFKDGQQVTEFNFDSPNKLVFDNGTSTDAEKEIALANTEVRLLFFSPIDTKTISAAAFMVIIGKEKQDLTKVHYKEFSNFNGRLLFYNSNGTLENGYTIENGKVMKSFGKVKLSSIELLNLKAKLRNHSGAYNSKSGSKLMLYDINSNCVSWVTTSEQTCTSFDLYQFSNKTKLNNLQHEKLMVGSDTYCRWTVSGEYVGSECQSSGNDGGYNGGSGGAGGQQGGGTGSGNTVNKDIIDSLRGYPCAQALLAKMKTPLNTDIGNLIKSTFAQNDDINVTFKIDKTLIGTTIDGNTSTGNFVTGYTSEQTVGLNPDVLNNSSQEYILVTMYHEALHAFFNKRSEDLKNSPGEFSRLYEGVTVNGGRMLGVNDDDHLPMAYNKYVSGLRDIILAFNPNFGSDRAMSLAKFGIITLLPEEKKDNAQERDTTKPGYKGTKCP
ncbi:hypothetical protein CBW18_08900 [Pedobacter sp. AJM]|nr:hypothetical protein CBW18_08900 [Pedobacter sp. AJM]